jgi:hypothetical protein
VGLETRAAAVLARHRLRLVVEYPETGTPFLLITTSAWR